MNNKILLRSQDRAEKVSDSIINQIRDLIISGELKPGDRIGSEKELIAQLGVSKASLREALRVLEVMRFIEIRKGLSGGVFVAEVDMKATLLGLMGFLRFESVSVKDITLMRYILEPVIVRIVTPLITDKDIEVLEEIIQSESSPAMADPSIRGIGFHRRLARLTRNPILILFMDFVDNLVMDIKMKVNFGDDFYQKVKAHHYRTISFMRRKDAVGAAKEIVADILFVGDRMAAFLKVPAFDPASIGKIHDDFSVDLGHPFSGSFEQIASNQDPLPFENGMGRSRKMLLRQAGKGRYYLLVSEED